MDERELLTRTNPTNCELIEQINFNKIESIQKRRGPDFGLVVDDEASLCRHPVIDE